MKIDDLLSLIETDSVIDPNKLDVESLKISQLHAKYYKIFMEEVRMLKSYDLKYGTMKKERQEYYMGLAPDEAYKAEPLNKKWLKSEIDIALGADVKLSEIDVKRDMQRQKVKMVEEFIKTLAGRSYNIKNSIEFLKFKNGVG